MCNLYICAKTHIKNKFVLNIVLCHRKQAPEGTDAESKQPQKEKATLPGKRLVKMLVCFMKYTWCGC